MLFKKRNSRKVYKKKTSTKSKARKFRSRIVKTLGIEKKEIVTGVNVNIRGNSSASTTSTPDSSIIRLDPNNSSMNILQGTRQDQRVGNKVKLTNGTFEMAMWPRSDSAGNTNNLQYVRFVCFYDKKNPTTTPTPYANLDFFQQSSATGYTGFSGTMYDLVNKINTDRYHVFWERTYKLGPAVLTGSADADPSYANQANNDFKAFYKRTFSLNKTCVKNLNYKDNTSDVNWRGCWIIAFGVAASSVANTADIQVANLFGQIRWKYLDA